MNYGLLLLALTTTPALADSIVFTLGSKHTRGNYEETNPGIGYEKQISERWTLSGGYYRNSNRHDSLYAGAIYTRWKLGEVRLGTSLGIVTGYGKPLPMLAPVVMWRNLNFVVIPPIGGSTGVVALQVKMPI